MTMVLELTEEQKERLQRFAEKQGKDLQTVVLEWVETLPNVSDVSAAGSANHQQEIPPPFPNLIAYIAPDFDDPLPDEFWLGDEANDPLYK